MHAVIGAQYGDEGKGLLVDYLSNHRTLVVRFNGGAQAGHTVVLSDGRRHEFHHLGAGCFKAACTLLSRFFVVNPLLYAREYAALPGVRRTVFVDPRALVTTPLDMMLNTLVEERRGAARHGSCGVGVNETVTRCQQAEYRLTVHDLTEEPMSSVRLRMLDYASDRAADLGVTLPTHREIRDVFCRWAADTRLFLRQTLVADDAALIRDAAPQVVFEGAQGLRLDEQAPGFPHVTRSRTGLTNVLTLLADAGLSAADLDVTYVTRAYVTRHGAGPLTCECDGHPFGWTGPETNMTNPYQGPLRYAKLNVVELAAAISGDRAAAPMMRRYGLAVTCLDQVALGRSDDDRAQRVAAAVGVPLWFVSHGPTREDVTAIRQEVAA